MKTKVYYAIFYRLEGERWGVRFPDASTINTFGNDPEEAQLMAVDALSGLMVVGRKGKEYNDPRPYDEIKGLAEDEELVFPVMVNETMMNAYRPKKRVNVMVPVDLLDQMDAVVKNTEGLDRSRFFCEAAEKYLAKQEGSA